MSDTLRLCFNVFITDGFKEAVREYAERENIDDVTGEDIISFLNDYINPATSKHETFEVEGGDTDGWFIQGGDVD